MRTPIETSLRLMINTVFLCQQNHIDSGPVKFNLKEFLRTFATVRLAGPKGCGHTTAILNWCEENHKTKKIAWLTISKRGNRNPIGVDHYLYDEITKTGIREKDYDVIFLENYSQITEKAAQYFDNWDIFANPLRESVEQKKLVLLAYVG